MTSNATVQTDTATAATAGQLAHVIWHCGWQKTGSTAIQIMMRRNKVKIEETVKVFPKNVVSQPLRRAMKSHFNDGSPRRAEVKALAEELINEVAVRSGPIALISDENLMGWRLFENGQSFVDIAKVILPILANAAAPATSQFIFYTRDIEAWLKSAHNQAIKNMRLTDDYDTWRAQLPERPDWNEILADLKSATGLDIVFRDMGQDRAEGMPLGGGLLAACGVAPDVIAGLSTASESNSSLPDSATEFMLAVNRSPMTDGGVRRIRMIVEENRNLFKDTPKSGASTRRK